MSISIPAASETRRIHDERVQVDRNTLYDIVLERCVAAIIKQRDTGSVERRAEVAVKNREEAMAFPAVQRALEMQGYTVTCRLTNFSYAPVSSNFVSHIDISW